jgi:anti-sigma-K factor RskA
MTPDHDEMQADCAVYVLGALAGDERRRFEQHLGGCDECSSEVRRLSVVADSLLSAITTVDPPAQLRARIVDAAVRERTPRVGASVVDVARQDGRKPSRSLLSLTGWLAAAASLVIAVGFAMRAADLRNRLDESDLRLREAVARLNDEAQRLQVSQRETTSVRQTLALLTAADTVELRLAGQAPARQASGRAFLSRSRGVLFAATNLPQIPSDRTYQVWYLTRGAPVSAGLIKPDLAGGATATFDAAAIPVFAGMAVSLEPDGGVPAPTGAIYLATQ